ncbi:MAG: hypothetical protein EXS16_07505 [Gemmataceae bacterium]|nr:hypothetical protein [Gemmataceae bacterium]
MKAVSGFEYNLLRMLRGIVTQVSPEQILPILAKPVQRPPCLSADAVALVKDILAKGMVRWLARHGWASNRYLREGVPVSGRLWERTPPELLGLKFSRWTLEFLLQLMSNTLGAKKPQADELELGDRLIFLHSYQAVRGDERAEKMQNHWPSLWSDGLCRLFFVEELIDAKTLTRIDWSPWLTEQGAAILESMQSALAERWEHLEARKQTFRDVVKIRQFGASQARVLGEYLDAIDAVHRRDLARCLLDAGRRVMRDRPTAHRWIGNLDIKRERIADRVLIYRDALAFLHALDRLRAWNEEASHVGYFDEGYVASQLWKAVWERFDGDATTNHAAEILREARPM